VALNVLALCFALSVLGRGSARVLRFSCKPISETFGWDRARWFRSIRWPRWPADCGAAGRPAVRPVRPRIVYSLGLSLLGGAFLIAACRSISGSSSSASGCASGSASR
jgi:hypothetical protein